MSRSGGELELLGAIVAERLDAGIDPGGVAGLIDTYRRAAQPLRGLGRADVATLDCYDGENAAGVPVDTFSRAKGLEFRGVLVPGMAASGWPSRLFVPPGLDDEQRAERVGLQLRTDRRENEPRSRSAHSGHGRTAD